MKQKLLVLFMFFGIYSNAQKICFEYDSAGNQIKRELCINSSENRTVNSIVSNEDTLQKFFLEDVISYYPNPVKEELFLEWELIDNKKVHKIEIYNSIGQSIKVFNRLEDLNSITISFIEYPAATYHVILYYSNEEQKSIKIIKK
ncbi:T9SS type A sorting domain-containing protein [Paenimyroides ceti]